MSETEYVKIFTGSFFEAQLIQTRLEDIGIEPILKDQFHVGLRAVLVSEYPSIIEIYVRNEELGQASVIVDSVKAELYS